jgi:sugar phosphate isomerase/epimerase
MKVGVQTRPWGPEMNREHLSEVLAEIASAGYDGFEIGAQHLDISQPEPFRQLVAGHGLEVVGIHVGGEIYDPQAVQEALDNLERIVAFAAQVGASFVPFSGRLKPDKTEEEYRYQAESLNRIGQLCRRSGLTLCYHNHFWEIENEYAELRYLCQHTDPDFVSLCLDVGWVERAGGSAVEAARTFLDRVAYFHLKDTKENEWMEVGYGTVDFPTLFQVIRGDQDWPGSRGAGGWLVVEQDETRRPPAESARMSREYLKRQFGV